MKNTAQAEMIKTWCSGDFVYGAVREYNAPAGTAYLSVDGREWPVARLSGSQIGGYSVVYWVRRSERFPEPIKGFNS